MSLKNFKLFFVSSWSHTLNKGAVRWGDDGGGGGAGAGEGGGGGKGLMLSEESREFYNVKWMLVASKLKNFDVLPS